MLKYEFVRFQLNCVSNEYLVKHMALFGALFYLHRADISRTLKTRKLLIFKSVVTTSLFIKVSQMVNSLKLDKKILIIEIAIHYLQQL